MVMIDPAEIAKQQRNEENTKQNLITPVIEAKWDRVTQIVMEYYFNDGRISVDEYGQAHRGKPKKADYLLLYHNNIPLAIVEAKGQDHSADEGYSQAIEYAEILDVPFAYSTNGHELLEFDRLSGLGATLQLNDLPGPEELWERYKREINMTDEVADTYAYPYYITPTGKTPRYYQRIIINRVTKAVLDGQKRILVVCATGTGKTYIAFQMIWRFLKTGLKKKVLFLADRNILVDQTMKEDFAPFEELMCKFDNSKIDTAHQVYLGIYQQFITHVDGEAKHHYKKYPRDFFDLIIIDECHRGSADLDSNWHEILDYFGDATKIGLTATPKYSEDASKSNIAYFGDPIYTYSLKQGIEDGFLAPYKVVVPQIDIDITGYTPEPGTLDENGVPVEIRAYEQRDFDRNIILPDRRKMVAHRIAEYMRNNDMRFGKAIVFCETQDHAHEMARLIGNENADLMAEDPRYCVTITADDDYGKSQLDNFITNKSKYPVIACTSKLLSTGVNAKTCELIVLDRTIGSMTEFKQIIGRGTRVVENYKVDGEDKSKMYFTILDFRSNYRMFKDPEFDGEPTDVVTVPPDIPCPKPPIKPDPDDNPIVDPDLPKRTARVSGVDVTIVGEIVEYMDENGDLVKQNLTSCVRNNIISSYNTPEEFREAWLLTSDKPAMAAQLLLDMDWSQGFEVRYGYAVDPFDVILCLGYDIDPPMSREHRSRSENIARLIESRPERQQELLKLLVGAYAESGFKPLRSLDIFNLPQFKTAGYTKLSAVKAFGGKDDYYKVLSELENAIYEKEI